MRAKQTKDRSGGLEGHRYIMLKPEIKENCKWQIKIINFKTFIGLGVGDLENLKSRNLAFDFNNNDHGGYMLSSNKCVWHGNHQEDNINYSQGEFDFGSGDIIILSYNVQKKELIIQKKGNLQEICKITDILIKGTIVPIANLCGEGDEIEIIY